MLIFHWFHNTCIYSVKSTINTNRFVKLVELTSDDHVTQAPSAKAEQRLWLLVPWTALSKPS